MGIGLAALLSLAEASEWYEALPVGAVSIVSTDGYIPEGDLQSLLTTQVGEPFSSTQVREDLSTLYTMGEFTAISVNLLNESFDENPFLHVQYELTIAPRLGKIEINADTRALKRLVADGIPYSLGQVFHPDVELRKLKKHVVSKLEAMGYVDVQIELAHQLIENQQVVLSVNVEQAISNVYASIDVVNLPKSLRKKYGKLLRTHQIKSGKRIQVRRLNDFKSSLQTLLQQNGWLDAKVRLLLQQTPHSGQELHVLIEPNKQVKVILRQSDLGFRLKRQLRRPDVLRDSLSLYSGTWLSENDLPRMTEALIGRLESKGYWDPRVQLTLHERPFEIVIYVDINAGIKHEIESILLSEDDIFTEAELRSTFTYERPELNSGLVFKEAYNRDIVTEGVNDIKEAYIGAGYLDVKVALQDDVIKHTAVHSHSLS